MAGVSRSLALTAKRYTMTHRMQVFIYEFAPLSIGSHNQSALKAAADEPRKYKIIGNCVARALITQEVCQRRLGSSTLMPIRESTGATRIAASANSAKYCGSGLPRQLAPP
jgi:hypothetical protein